MNEPTSRPDHERQQRRRPRGSPTAILGALLIAASTAFAVPPGGVPGVTPSRSGNDLVISWAGLTTPVDGFRVYKATDAACSSLTVVYTGTGLSHTVVGAFLDPAAAMYAVAAYVGPDEGPRSLPIYKFALDLPAPGPTGYPGRLVSVPFDPVPSNARDLCFDLNRAQTSEPIRVLQKSMPSTATILQQSCSSTKLAFNLVPGEAYVAAQSQPTTVSFWGEGDDAAIYRFEARYDPPPVPSPPESCATGLNYVGLPWDHDYPDLASIAAASPTAVLVAVYDGTSAVVDCLDYDTGRYQGLHRATTADPWSGTNYPLDGRRGEGVVIAHDTLGIQWQPRRQCLTFSGGPTGPGNIPPVAVPGGPYDQAVCNGGLVGLSIDGTASFDPDNTGTLQYQWSTTCTGTFFDDNAPLTTASFDCDPCLEDTCQVTLRVTDGGGAWTESTTNVLTRRLPTCLVAGNVLRMTRFGGGSELSFDWTAAPSAQSYLLLNHLDRPQLIPRYVNCGAGLSTMSPVETGPTLEFFRVEAFDSPCPAR